VCRQAKNKNKNIDVLCAEEVDVVHHLLKRTHVLVDVARVCPTRKRANHCEVPAVTTHHLDQKHTRARARRRQLDSVDRVDDAVERRVRPNAKLSPCKQKKKKKMGVWAKISTPLGQSATRGELGTWNVKTFFFQCTRAREWYGIGTTTPSPLVSKHDNARPPSPSRLSMHPKRAISVSRRPSLSQACL
jgi:hypothetical protein